MNINRCLIGILFVWVSFSAMGGGADMSCDSEAFASIKNKIMIGDTKSAVENVLKGLAVRYDVINKENFSVGGLREKSEAEAYYQSKIIFVVHTKSGGFVRSDELVTMGFDVEGRLLDMVCDKVFTGP